MERSRLFQKATLVDSGDERDSVRNRNVRFHENGTGLVLHNKRLSFSTSAPCSGLKQLSETGCPQLILLNLMNERSGDLHQFLNVMGCFFICLTSILGAVVNFSFVDLGPEGSIPLDDCTTAKSISGQFVQPAL